ncbi:hypothetical protein GQ44DRAFT_691123, partial [Phaeosphaeriaceae sp. PMI808]
MADQDADPVGNIEDTEIAVQDLEVVVERRACKCATKDSRLANLLANVGNKRLTDAARKNIVDEFHREVYDRSSKRDKGGKTYDFDRVCWAHKRFACGKLGLVTRTLTNSKIHELLILFYQNPHRWGDWQANPVISILFTESYRGTHTSEDLKSYRYRPGPVRVPINWDQVCEAMDWEGFQKEYHETGSVVMNLFEEFDLDDELATIVTESFNMYSYHTRMINGRSNLGWCRIMFHSLIQQLVRGDIRYWLIYAILRKTPHLISYPYYTKHALVGQNTYFRHVDLNVAEAVRSGKGADMIQGSVSFNDENNENCTEILVGFHKIAREWLLWRRASGLQDSSGYIQGWKDSVDWKPEFSSRYPKVKWIKQVCMTGEVRISNPLLPHGSTGPATIERRTILPWYVKVQDDMKTMENPEMGSYQELMAANAALLPGPRTPSGHPNRYGGVNWPFPADLPYDSSSWISKAIMGLVRWDSPLVQQEL